MHFEVRGTGYTFFLEGREVWSSVGIAITSYRLLIEVSQVVRLPVVADLKQFSGFNFSR